MKALARLFRRFVYEAKAEQYAAAPVGVFDPDLARRNAERIALARESLGDKWIGAARAQRASASEAENIEARARVQQYIADIEHVAAIADAGRRKKAKGKK